MAHVFIVNKDTLKIHLENMFAGTGAKEIDCNFLNDEENNNIKSEKLLCSMIADVSRINIGDKILFYLQASGKNEGMFFGSFKASSKAFLATDNYPEELNGIKLLPFRIKIEPDEVFEYGITERECLDSLKGIRHPSEMCWSLIYRKLKGNRGCTMITEYEYLKIMDKIKNKNKNKELGFENYSLEDEKIIKSSKKSNYVGEIKKINIDTRLLLKFKTKHAFEAHLQAYIMQNQDKIKEKLKNPQLPIKWIGNEIFCGVGMQSIDAMIIQENEKNVYISICELKDEEVYKNIGIDKQINKYINWVEDYINPTYKNKKIIMYPIIIAKNNEKNNEKNYTFIKSIKKEKLKNLEYIEFCLKENNLELKKVEI